jgi:hypothetical protein
MIRTMFLAAVVAASTAWAQEGEGGPLVTRCTVGSTTVQIELRDTGDGLGTRTVHVVRKGQTDLEVKFEEAAVRSFVSPGKGKSACEKTVAVSSGDALLIGLAEEGHPYNPFLVSFVYVAGRHEAGWRRRNKEQDRIAPESEGKVAFTKDGFCLPTRLLGEADVGICRDEECGRTHNANITLINTGMPFDVYRCFQISGESGRVSVDGERTWKAAWPELKSVLKAKEAFERAFEFNGIQYGQTGALRAKLADGRTCLFPSAPEARPPSEPDAWICPGDKKAK